MLPGTTGFSCSRSKPLQLCSLSWGNTLRGRAKVSWNAACRQGCGCRGQRQFIPVKLVGSAHTSLMGSNWLQKVCLACHVGCSCLTTQQSGAKGSTGKNKHGQGDSFCPKKHSQAQSSSNEQHWQGSKDAVLWKMSSFPRLELFWGARIKSGFLKNVFIWKNSVFVWTNSMLVWTHVTQNSQRFRSQGTPCDLDHPDSNRCARSCWELGMQWVHLLGSEFGVHKILQPSKPKCWCGITTLHWSKRIPEVLKSLLCTAKLTTGSRFSLAADTRLA